MNNYKTKIEYVKEVKRKDVWVRKVKIGTYNGETFFLLALYNRFFYLPNLAHFPSPFNLPKNHSFSINNSNSIKS